MQVVVVAEHFHIFFQKSLSSLCLTLTFIGSWLKSPKENYMRRTTIYCKKMCELFKKIIVNIPETKPDNHKNKRQHLLTYV